MNIRSAFTDSESGANRWIRSDDGDDLFSGGTWSGALPSTVMLSYVVEMVTSVVWLRRGFRAAHTNGMTINTDEQ